MKYVAAYPLAQLSAATAESQGFMPPEPDQDDVRCILDSVGVAVDEARLDALVAQLDGKDFAELIAAGSQRFAYAPCGAVGGAAAPAGAAAAGAAAEPKEEEKKKEEEKVAEEGDDEAMFSLFDD